jgi:zinc transport system substrate-binding protein
MQRLLFRISLGVIAVFAAGLAYIAFFPENQMLDLTKDDGRISITATIYPLAFFAMGLNPIADITTIIGADVEPHDFEPTIRDVKAMQDAEILLVNGTIDEWALRAVEADGRVHSTILALDSLNLPEFDPHFWLDPVYAQEIVFDIGHQLEQADSGNAERIYENTRRKISELAAIDTAYKETLVNCEIPEIVTAHDAFGFLARRYGFTVHGIAGLNPEEEPSVSAMAELVDLVRTRNITTVFFESSASDALAQTIASEAGVKVDVLYPLESLAPGYDAATGYTEMMLSNLEKLSTAMVCHP